MPPKITLKTVLEHMVAMEQRIYDRFEHRLDNLEKRIALAESNLTYQLDAIDSRLDDLELAELPRRVSLLESK